MAGAPQFLALGKSRDSTHPVELWVRRAVLAGITLLALLALLNVFGQRPVTTAADGAQARMEVQAPTALRGGLFFMGRITIEAQEELENPTLVLDRGWLESMHVNTIEPAPTEEESRDGRLALSYGRLAAGETAVVYLQLQVNPTNVGRRSQGVELHDGEELVARSDRTVTILP